MKYALINGEKVEATKGAEGICRVCGNKVSAFCGDEYVHHWKHDKKCKCDSWWEKETKWHRMWKDNFPTEWQEVVHFDNSGEKHIADVKTQNGWTIEFQHSFLNSEERQSRIGFYQKLIWVVDGTRRKTDKKQFQKMLEESTKLRTNIPIVRCNFPEECRLLKEWHHNKTLVFFDFKEMDDAEHTMLWFLFPKTPSGSAYLSPFSRSSFIESFNNDNFDELFNKIIAPIHTEITNGERRQQAANIPNRTNTLSGFDRYIRMKQRRQRRF
jgi:hypothetical protein